MSKPAPRVLKDFGLRHTACREEVLDLFLERQFALSHADIETGTTGFDRVTVYRTLKTFLDKGLIHKVLDDTGLPKYALCREACTHAGHRHEHVHFKCVRCGQTNCLENVQIPNVALPPGYYAEEASLLMQGVCNVCHAAA